MIDDLIFYLTKKILMGTGLVLKDISFMGFIEFS